MVFTEYLSCVPYWVSQEKEAHCQPIKAKCLTSLVIQWHQLSDLYLPFWLQLPLECNPSITRTTSATWLFHDCFGIGGSRKCLPFLLDWLMKKLFIIKHYIQAWLLQKAFLTFFTLSSVTCIACVCVCEHTSVKCIVVGIIKAPQRCLHPYPQNLWRCYLALLKDPCRYD